MFGGPGDDHLFGGQGVDDMAGNTGADALVLLGKDRANGGFGIDVCKAYAWDTAESRTSCERSATPGPEDTV
jgi:hypothetical protein